MTAATRKANERQRRKAEGQVALSGWLSASDHAALTQMARDAGLTQAQVVGRLIAERGLIERQLECQRERTDDLNDQASLYVSEVNHLLGLLRRIFILGRPSGWPSDLWNEVCAPTLPSHSDLTAAVGLW